MNDSQSDAAAQSESELELFAIEEHFAEAFHANAGPRLSDYIWRYPQYAEELAAFVSNFLPAAALEAEDALDAHTESLAPKLSLGTRRALDSLFTGWGAQPPADETLLVAEERAVYAAQPAGLEALAETRGLSLEALAERANLSQDGLTEVMRLAARAPDTLSPDLVRRIAEVLGVAEDEAIRALARGV
jgi:lambda repressor-like predicted transcriptional regulator